MKFEIFFLTAFLFISTLTHGTLYIDDSINQFNDLDTLKNLVINKSFMQCFF